MQHGRKQAYLPELRAQDEAAVHRVVSLQVRGKLET